MMRDLSNGRLRLTFITSCARPQLLLFLHREGRTPCPYWTRTLCTNFILTVYPDRRIGEIQSMVVEHLEHISLLPEGRSSTILESLPFPALIEACGRENRKFTQRQDCDDRYGMELFRRAIVQRNDWAWVSIYDLYTPYVQFWITQSQKSMILLRGEDMASLVNATFGRFYRAITPTKWNHFPSLASLLKYLKRCAFSEVQDTLRSLNVLSHLEQPLDAIEQDFIAGYDDPSDLVVSHLFTQHVWHLLERELHSEEEQAFIRLAFVEGMKPAEISREYRHLFPSVHDVYRVRRNIVERLRRNRVLRQIAKEAAPLSSLENLPTFSSQLKVQPSVKDKVLNIETTHASVPNFEQERQTFLALMSEYAVHKVRLTILEAIECRLLTQQALPSPTQTLLRHPPVHIPHPEKPWITINYYYRLNRCQNPDCQICQREGGHGPYWRAYWYENGKRFQKDYGKICPPEIQGPSGTYAQPKYPSFTIHRDDGSTITYRWQRLSCGKKKCRICQRGIPHDSKWYSYEPQRGRHYVGKNLPPSVTCPESVQCLIEQERRAREQLVLQKHQSPLFPPLLSLSEEDTRAISEVVTSQTASPKEIFRASIVWYASQGLRISEIAEHLNITATDKENPVRFWLQRFREAGLEGLQDRPRTGASPTYNSEVVVLTALTEPSELGQPFAYWTLDLLQAYLNEHGVLIKRSRIAELLRAEGLSLAQAKARAVRPAK